MKFFLTIALLFLSFPIAGVQGSVFDVPKTPWIQKQVGFWVRIYSEFSEDQGLLHDALYVDKVYEVMDLRGLKKGTKKHQINTRKEHWRKILMSIHQKKDKPETLNDEERRIFQMYADVDKPNRFIEARQKKRIRFQLGQKNRFESALLASGEYLPHMEKIFESHGVPKELTRLPFVESSFNPKAMSKVGASGMWQFIRSTGRKYMIVSPIIDERNDPILASSGAARLLKDNFDSIGSWPLAVTAYNHGRTGMMKATRRLGSTDVEQILVNYNSPSFGFASRNFLMELLAAIEVEKNAETYFGDFKRSKPLEFVEVTLEESVSMPVILKHTEIPKNVLQPMNPALTSLIWKGAKRVPKGYKIKLPTDLKEVFWMGYQKIPDKFKFKTS